MLPSMTVNVNSKYIRGIVFHCNRTIGPDYLIFHAHKIYDTNVCDM